MGRHVMVDLETLGNGSKACIVAIGAVAFSAEGIFEKEAFYCVVDPESAVDAGMEIDASTVLWWLGQSEAARKAIIQASTGKPLAEALVQFSAWFARVEGETLWGNGATFDNVILSSAYKLLKLPQPWNHRGDRCYRTLKALYPDPSFKPAKANNLAHHALHDAVYQAQHASRILQHIAQASAE